MYARCCWRRAKPGHRGSYPPPITSWAAGYGSPGMWQLDMHVRCQGMRANILWLQTVRKEVVGTAGEEQWCCDSLYIAPPTFGPFHEVVAILEYLLSGSCFDLLWCNALVSCLHSSYSHAASSTETAGSSSCWCIFCSRHTPQFVLQDDRNRVIIIHSPCSFGLLIPESKLW